MRTLLVLFFLCVYATVCLAQGGTSSPNLNDLTKPIDILPPSPQSASLGQYGGINFGLASGTVSYNIPIYQLASTSLQLPISLDYSSNGVRVDAIAGRVGTGWNLNAGGVVTRTVLGVPDEGAERIQPPSTYPQRNRALIDFMESLSSGGQSGAIDGEPDVFSFNFAGYDGRFVLDANLKAILLTPSAIKVETDFVSSTWNIKITTPDGVQYFFGGANATENSKTYSSGTNCGKNYLNFYPTAWYLTSIVHPNNDQITFSYSQIAYHYKAGTSASLFYKLTAPFTTCSGTTNGCGVLSNTNCLSWYSTSTPLLEEINTNSGIKLKFTYSNRQDIGDRLLKTIELFQPAATTAIRVFDLNYNEVKAIYGTNSYSTTDASLLYRPFLMEVVEHSTDGNFHKNHQFIYEDKEALPSRLSYAQDHYGFYNGAVMNNGLIPPPSIEAWKSYFPSASANRETDGVSASKGLLNKIICPTGGYDELLYEANTVKTTITVEPPLQEVFAQAFSGDIYSEGTETKYSEIITVNYGQTTVLRGSCRTRGSSEDAIHNRATVAVINSNTGAVVFSKGLTPGQTVEQEILLNPGVPYQVRVTANGVNLDAVAGFSYRAGNLTYQDINKPIGGVRVAKVRTSSEIDGSVSVKKYNYHSVTEPAFSSGGAIYEPVYQNVVRSKVPCLAEGGQSGSVVNCSYTDCDNAAMYSNTLNNIFLYGGSPVYYQSVIESFGENYENGGIEHQFIVTPDVQGGNRMGDYVQGAPYTSYRYKNGLETFQQVFKMVNGVVAPVKKVVTHYKEDDRGSQTVTSYLATKKYAVTCQFEPPSDDEINAYNLVEYNHLRRWIYADTVRTLTYNEAGQQAVEQIEVRGYANPAHALPTLVKTFNSDGSTSSVTNFYPQDITLSGEEETARQTLIQKNIVTPVLKQTLQKGSTLLLTTQNNYKLFTNGLVLPSAKWGAIKNNALEERFVLSAYNDKGQLLEQKKSQDASNSYLWGYGSLYPVAQAVNAAANEIYYNSFEEGSEGAHDPAAKTGKKSFTGNFSVSFSLPANTLKSFIVAYWSHDGSQWNYKEEAYAGGGKLLTGGKIDEVRIFPVGAQMTTYTYEPLVGMTSQTDANGNTTYYEYDGLGRNSLVRDERGNILKKICYNYYGQVESCGQPDRTPNWVATGVTRCKPCDLNPAYNSTTFQREEKDMNSYSSSYTSPRWMDDNSGTCTSLPDWQNTTTPIRCKMVNGVNTGEREQEQKNLNPCSTGGGDTRWVVVETNCTLCAKPANWQLTGRTQCVKSGGVNTSYLELEEKDMEPCSATAGQTNWYIAYQDCSTCPKPQNWVATGSTRCIKDGSGNNTSYLEREEMNIESCSPAYNTSRWVLDKQDCATCPKAQNWQPTGLINCVQDGNGLPTGQKQRQERNLEPCSIGYNTLRFVDDGQDCSICPKLPNWQPTGPTRCVQSGGVNTGYQEREEKDLEPCSTTYNQFRWASAGYNPTACPLPSGCNATNCSGNDKKCINNKCETGIKVYTSSVPKTGGGYTCTYHYEWSNGTWSSNYTETKASPCPVR